ncbi:hypothetical protein LTR10_005511 [Elasticomyces elasticus]|nr:hypothetical protein LTR10_005511 [Elasticomyces elasticus]KAK4976247.1 hypothetical protein LTR42_003876 [Elasticomyces elasticus]
MTMIRRISSHSFWFFFFFFIIIFTFTSTSTSAKETSICTWSSNRWLPGHQAHLGYVQPRPRLRRLTGGSTPTPDRLPDHPACPEDVQRLLPSTPTSDDTTSDGPQCDRCPTVKHTLSAASVIATYGTHTMTMPAFDIPDGPECDRCPTTRPTLHAPSITSRTNSVTLAA